MLEPPAKKKINQSPESKPDVMTLVKCTDGQAARVARRYRRCFKPFPHTDIHVFKVVNCDLLLERKETTVVFFGGNPPKSIQAYEDGCYDDPLYEEDHHYECLDSDGEHRSVSSDQVFFPASPLQLEETLYFEPTQSKFEVVSNQIKPRFDRDSKAMRKTFNASNVSSIKPYLYQNQIRSYYSSSRSRSDITLFDDQFCVQLHFEQNIYGNLNGSIDPSPE